MIDRELCARNERHSDVVRCLSRLLDARECVVVHEGRTLKARGVDDGHEFRRRVGPVRSTGMKVEVGLHRYPKNILKATMDAMNNRA